jgi:hypothetical protein
VKHREKQILVEFRGEVSPENRRPMLRRYAWRNTLLFFAITATFGLLASLIFIDSGWRTWLIMAGMSLAVALLFPSLIFPASISKKEQQRLCPAHVCIYEDSNEPVLIESQSYRLETYLDDFRKIVDMGSHYYVYFHTQIGTVMIFQKNLLVQGTIEEFEALFGDKLIRKDS